MTAEGRRGGEGEELQERGEKVDSKFVERGTGFNLGLQ